MFGSLGFTELILILVIVLIIFGAGKLPQLGEGVGKAIKGFKKSLQEAEAFDVDPQAEAQEGATVSPSVPPQISQPVQAAVVETPVQPQPEVVQAAAPSEPVVAPSKA